MDTLEHIFVWGLLLSFMTLIAGIGLAYLWLLATAAREIIRQHWRKS